jgi:hypothetical protein
MKYILFTLIYLFDLFRLRTYSGITNYKYVVGFLGLQISCL